MWSTTVWKSTSVPGEFRDDAAVLDAIEQASVDGGHAIEQVTKAP